jgi:enoyl-[acyl-carrier protein] reductase/trans-2-enoyl-CoA reductase (NAD+)
MTLQVLAPRIRGFVCTNAHPVGCARRVSEQAAVARTKAPSARGGNALIIGASTGYGLAARIAAAFGHGMHTLGVFLERPPDARRTASAGWYNTAAFHEAARACGLYCASINVDAFARAARRQVVECVARDLGQLGLVVYSLAAPMRLHPETGELLRSSLKPIGEGCTLKTVDLERDEVVEVSLEPATPAEIAATVAVMGGDDLRLWVDCLLEAGLLARGAHVVSFSYVGPEITWPIYHSGTIGRAKADLEATSRQLDALLSSRLGGRSLVSVNKAIVTQASAAIPAVPLYLSLLSKQLASRRLNETAIDQMRRLLGQILTPGSRPELDDQGRLRLDDQELRPDVQADVAELWSIVDTANLAVLSDYDGFKTEFRRLFGFEVDGIDYAEPVETDVALDLMQ